ncbi:hypothetical protein HMPREF1429_00843, partial [Helicobacter pylori GAM93Bi]
KKKKTILRYNVPNTFLMYQIPITQILFQGENMKKTLLLSLSRFIAFKR